MKNYFLAIAVLFLGGFATAEPKVDVAGVQVVWKSYEDSFQFGGVLNTNSPVKVALVISAEGLGVLGLSDEESEVKTFKDGSGNDLEGELGSFPKRSEDGKLLMVEVEGKKYPAAGSSELSLTGVVTVLMGQETKSHKTGVMKWSKGALIGLPEELSLKIREAKKPEWGEDPWSVDLELPSPPEVVKAIRFLDAEGAEIESSKSGSASFGGFGKRTYTATYSLKKAVEEVVIEVEVYTDLEKVKVPLDLKIGGE